MNSFPVQQMYYLFTNACRDREKGSGGGGGGGDGGGGGVGGDNR